MIFKQDIHNALVAAGTRAKRSFYSLSHGVGNSPEYLAAIAEIDEITKRAKKAHPILFRPQE